MCEGGELFFCGGEGCHCYALPGECGEYHDPCDRFAARALDEALNASEQGDAQQLLRLEREYGKYIRYAEGDQALDVFSCSGELVARVVIQTTDGT
jgi:hypothetical protein